MLTVVVSACASRALSLGRAELGGAGGSVAGVEDQQTRPVPGTRPGPVSALPPVWARVTAFVAVLLGGLGGGVIGHSYASLACPGGPCTLSRGWWLLGGATAGALGVAVIAVITLRVAGEWRITR